MRATITQRRAPRGPERLQLGNLAAHEPARPAWWIHPTWALLVIIFPILLLTLVEGPAGLTYFKNYVDNYTTYNCFAAVASLLAFCCGTLVFGVFGAGPADAVSPFDPVRAELALRWLGVTALAAYILLLGPWLLNPEIVLQTLQGVGTESAREAMARMPGVTSFTNVAPVFCALWSAARLDSRFQPSTALRWIFFALALFTLARTIVGAERLALVEFVAPLLLTYAAFHTRPSIVRAAFPVLGLIALVVFFAAAEYFRSWQYYQFASGMQFWEFSALRFVGYYSTALNNGMGMFQLHSPLDLPYFTAGAMAKLPIWPLLGTGNGNVSDDIWGVYLFEFGNPEFNNLSGLFAPLIDFGSPLGLMFMGALGIVVGLLYRGYVRRRVTGLLLYPTCFVGTVEIIRLFYLGESRVVPVFLAAGLVGWFLSGGPALPRMALRRARRAAFRRELGPKKEPA